MTSEHTKEPTLDFFRRQNYFGLEEDNLIVFEQGMLPCFTFDGKIIMESKSQIAKSPGKWKIVIEKSALMFASLVRVWVSADTTLSPDTFRFA